MLRVPQDRQAAMSRAVQLFERFYQRSEKASWWAPWPDVTSKWVSTRKVKAIDRRALRIDT